MAALLFSIVIVFLLCHTTRLALNIYEAVQVKLICKDNLVLINYSPIYRWCIMVQSGYGLSGQTTSLGGTISCWWLTVLLIFSSIRLRWLTQNQVLRNKKKCQFKDFKFREALLLQLRCKKAPKRRESVFHLTGQQLI